MPTAKQRLPERHQPPDDQAELEDDSIIGRAFGWSLAILATLAVIAGLIGLFGWLGQSEPEPVEEAQALNLDELLAVPEQPTAPAAVFIDEAAERGVDFVHFNGAFGERLLPETMGGGVAVLDYNGNGDQDLLFVNGDSWPFDPNPAPTRPTLLRLYANDGQGGFVDVTEAVGLGEFHGYGMGVAVGDVDGDGRIDLYVTTVGPNRLLLNREGGFVEATALAGVAGNEQEWSTGAALLDVDADGDLDLMVTNYVTWSRAIDLAVDYRLTGIGRAYGPPTNFGGAPNRLYLNDGQGRFEEVTDSSGLEINHPTTGESVGKGLALVPVDLDRDGRLDVVVANDTVRNFAFRNLGDGRFEDIATESGLGFDRNGLATGAMGIDAGPILGDDRLAIAIGNFANEMSSFYVSQAGLAQFADQSIAQGVGAATRQALTFGVGFIDYDNDGRPDFVQANGHVENEINRVQSSQHFRQPGQLFWQCGPDCSQPFQAVPDERIGDLARPIVGRGLAWGDFDRDGRIDLVLTQVAGPPLLLMNRTETGHHWLTIALENAPPNTSAFGAEVQVETGRGPDARVQRQLVNPTRSYLSQVALPLHFGLGRADQVERIVVTWPDGRLEELEQVPADQHLVIRRHD